MKHSLYFLIIFIITTCLNPNFANAEKHRVAVIIPLSGPVASLGQYVRKGLDLAYANLDPKIRDSIELVYEDDQFDAKQTITAYRSIAAKGPIDAVLVVGSTPANAIAPLTEQNKQILIAIGASDSAIVKDRKFAFIHWVIPEVLGRRLAEELVARDYKRIAVVAAEASGAIADATAAVDALTKLGFKDRIVFNETYPKDQSDFRSAIGSIRAKNADVVVLIFFPGALSSFAKQVRDLKLPAEIVGMETFEDEGEVKAADGALTGTWYVNASDPNDEFVGSYKKKWGEQPGWASANGYDTLNLLAQAFSVGKGNSEEIRNFLGNINNYNGAAGTYSASGDNRFTLPATLKRVTETGFERIEPRDPLPMDR